MSAPNRMLALLEALTSRKAMTEAKALADDYRAQERQDSQAALSTAISFAVWVAVTLACLYIHEVLLKKGFHPANWPLFVVPLVCVWLTHKWRRRSKGQSLSRS